MRLISLHQKGFLRRSWLLLALWLAPISAFQRVQAFSSSMARLPIRSSSSITKSTLTLQSLRLNQSKEDSNMTPKEQDHHGMNPALELVGKTTSTVVAAIFMSVLTWKRDALMVSFFVGGTANAILSKILKKIIRQERPMEDYGSETVSLLERLPPSANGMPSSHAMSLGFLGTFTGLLLARKYHPYSSLLLVVYASISLWYRIKAKLHTWEQVAVGVIVGSTNALFWRCLCFGTTQPFQASPPKQDLPIHITDFVTKHWLNEQGRLPITGLVIPIIIAALIVGSVERRIGRFLEMNKEGKEAAPKQTENK